MAAHHQHQQQLAVPGGDPGAAAVALTSTPPGYDRGNCRSCGALMFWSQLEDAYGELKRYPEGHAKAGKPVAMPMDAQPKINGNIRLTGRGRVRFITAGELLPTDERRYVSHFAVCPHRSQHRRTKKGGKR